MKEAFKKRQLLFMLQLVIVTGILYLLHSYLLNNLSADTTYVLSLWNIYLFHLISVFLVYSIINFRFSNGEREVFNSFIVLMVLKMIFVVIFLLPLFLSDATDKIGDAVNFFVPYFILLAFEVYSINKVLTAK
ncbi:MAG: hypothetical protein AAGC45_04185 [Bacteroidota bacterium]